MRTALLVGLLVMPAALGQPKPPGEKLIADYFRTQVKQIADRSLADLSTREAWEAKRPELRRQFLDMMGLWPLPARTPLNARITGTVTGQGFVVEKLVFESRPGLYVTANLYKPVKAEGKRPAVLYVCGHGNVEQDGVSFGSKVKYQYHPAWFAAHGYVCLVLDTLQLSEIPGIHHGTYRLGLWWWQSRGYTPGGVELWNAMRALDYLETRPEVDAGKIGLTGRSGGGATSWWLAAADDRVKAVAPVAGIADLWAHVCEGQTDRLRGGVIAGHCDCMFMVNTYRWDFAQVAALVAPRPLLLGNSDADDIFPVAGYRRLADKVRKVYALYGADEQFQLLETKGPHVDTPELRTGINKWMNRWLKGDTTTAVSDDLPPALTPQQLKVLDATPAGQKNTTIHETFVPQAQPDTIPATGAAEWWAKRRAELLGELKAKTFAGWPADPGPPSVRLSDTTASGRSRTVIFASEPGVELPLGVRTAPGGRPRRLLLHVAGGSVSDRPPAPTADTAVATVAVRGVGLTRWADPDSPADIHIRRRFALIGQTLDGQRLWDVRRAVQALGAMPETKGLPITLHGEGTAAGIALYAGLFEPSVAGFELVGLPKSHRDGPALLNVLKVLDLPQAVALAAPRPVTLRAVNKADWEWPLRLQSAAGGKWLTVAD
ncbi:MAG: prolyl oligopeptidase family serine peptidase [Gemmataceae bacterium]